MKNLWLMLVMMVCVSACSSGGDDPVEPTPTPEVIKPEITIDAGIVSNGLSFNAAKGENTLSFTTNTDWSLSIAETRSGATWCTASPTSGSKGTANVKFTTTENTEYEDRSVTVTIKAGTANKTFKITQKAADALLVTTTKYEVPKEGGQIEIEVKSNIDYQMAISKAAKEWIVDSGSNSRALNTHKHVLDIAANEDANRREGEITFKSGNKVETVKVYQAGEAVLLLSQSEYTVSDAGETISVDIKSNVEYDVLMPDVDWLIDESSSRGLSSHTMKFAVAANETHDSRSAEIIFSDRNSDLKDTLKVIQVQKDAIILSQKEVNVKSEGETIEVKLSANVELGVIMPDVDWISQINSRVLKEHTFYFEVAKNEEEENRSAEILFFDKNSDLQDVLTVVQMQADSIGQSSKTNIILSEKNITTSWVGTSVSVKINTDVTFDIEVPQIYNWISLAEIYYEAGTASFSIDYNNKSNKEREGYVIFKSKDHRISNDTLTISQEASGGFLEAYLQENYGDYYKGLDSLSIDFAINAKDMMLLRSLMGNRLEYLDMSKAKIISDKYNVPNSHESYWTFEDVVDNFDYCSRIKHVILPNSAQTIKQEAFEGSENLENVVFGTGIHTIEDYAFKNCYSLKVINFPDNVILLGKNLFENCSSLTRVNIKAVNPPTIAAGTFKDCRSDLKIYVPAASLEAYKNADYWKNMTLLPDNQ